MKPIIALAIVGLTLATAGGMMLAAGGGGIVQPVRAGGDVNRVTAAKTGLKTATLGVPMSCPTCPFIVKRSLEKVAGVKDVTVSYQRQIAVVRFATSETNVEALTAATGAVGFPSRLLTIR